MTSFIGDIFFRLMFAACRIATTGCLKIKLAVGFASMINTVNLEYRPLSFSICFVSLNESFSKSKTCKILYFYGSGLTCSS